MKKFSASGKTLLRAFSHKLKLPTDLPPVLNQPLAYEEPLLTHQERKHHHHQRLIPKDVPKGHVVVYVGRDQKRFVIRVEFLGHPLFQALLDQAQQEYGFSSPDSRLCIPCEESSFDRIVRYIQAQQRDGVCPCF